MTEEAEAARRAGAAILALRIEDSVPGDKLSAALEDALWHELVAVPLDTALDRLVENARRVLGGAVILPAIAEPASAPPLGPVLEPPPAPDSEPDPVHEPPTTAPLPAAIDIDAAHGSRPEEPAPELPPFVAAAMLRRRRLVPIPVLAGAVLLAITGLALVGLVRQQQQHAALPSAPVLQPRPSAVPAQPVPGQPAPVPSRGAPAVTAPPSTAPPPPPVRILAASHQPVSSLMFSPDGQVLAAAGGDRTIGLWDVASGTELRSLQAHAGAVRTIAFSPAGDWLASAGDDKLIKLWKPKASGPGDSEDPAGDGQAVHTLTLTGYAGYPTCLAFAPGGLTLAAGTSAGRIELWETNTGRKTRSFGGSAKRINALAFAPDGTSLATGGDDNAVTLWSAAEARPLRALTGHVSFVEAVEFTSDGRRVISGSRDQTIKVWAVVTGAVLLSLSYPAPVDTVAVSPDGDTVAAAGRTGGIKLWNLVSGREIGRLGDVDVPVAALAFSPDGRLLAAAGAGVALWNVAKTAEASR